MEFNTPIMEELVDLSLIQQAFFLGSKDESKDRVVFVFNRFYDEKDIFPKYPQHCSIFLLCGIISKDVEDAFTQNMSCNLLK